MPHFEIIGGITNRETIDRGGGIRELAKLREEYGGGNWRKCKGEAKVEFADGTICDVEIHWYEAHGIGRRREKIKRVLR